MTDSFDSSSRARDASVERALPPTESSHATVFPSFSGVPTDFVWPGTICRDFEDEESEAVHLTATLLRAALSRQHRTRYPITVQCQRQRQIEALMHEHLMRLDLHNAGLRFDRHRMRTVNVGLAEWLTEASVLTETHFSRVNSQAQQIAEAEESRRREVQAETGALRRELEGKLKQAEEAEREARALESEVKRAAQVAKDAEFERQKKELQEIPQKEGRGGFQKPVNAFFAGGSTQTMQPRRPRLSP
jgi:hypothetical protein